MDVGDSDGRQVDVAARNWCAVPIISASDLSGLSCRPFCMYHCLTSAVYAARTDSPADVLSARTARRSCVVSILVVLNTMACNDVSNWTGVDGEQDGSQY